MKIELFYPKNTMAISVTGKNCQLQCRHCGGRYLKSMKTPADIEHIGEIPENISSFLISGGCNKDGSVPIYDNIELLEKLKKSGYRLNIHTGLIPHDKIEEISAFADTVSFDFIADDDVINEVYGIKKTKADYEETLIRLAEHVNVVPHITIGIKGGKLSCETDAVERLAALGFKRIVFIIFIPTRDTYYEKCSSPSLKDVEKVIKRASEAISDASLGLGCMHPRGDYKRELEMLCCKYGFSSYVNPSREFFEFLSAKEDELIIRKECCAL